MPERSSSHNKRLGSTGNLAGKRHTASGGAQHIQSPVEQRSQPWRVRGRNDSGANGAGKAREVPGIESKKRTSPMPLGCDQDEDQTLA